MENVNNAKKFFSDLGFRMLICTIIIFGAQIGMMKLFQAVLPAKMENYDFAMAVTMLPLFVIGYPITLRILRHSPEQKKYVNRRDKHEMTVGQILVAFLMAYGILVVGNLLGLGITSGIAAVRGEEVVNPLVEVVSNGSVLSTAIYTVILAPAFEELIFRKMIIDKTVCYGERTAMVLSGIMFGLFHGNFNQFFYAFFLGMFLAFIYIRTNNLKYNIILHAMINFLGSVVGGAMLKQLAVGGDANMAIAGAISLVIYAIAISGLVLLIVKRKKLVLQPVEGELEKKGRGKIVYGNAGMILYILFFVAFMVCQSFGLIHI